MTSSSRRCVYFEARSQRGFQRGLALIDGHSIFCTEINAIEAAAAAEHLLGGVSVHDGQIPAECLCHSGGAHDAADGELLLTFYGHQRNLAVHVELVSLGELFRDQE